LAAHPPALHVRCTEEETEEEPAPLPARIIVVILSPLLLLLRGGGGGPAAAAPLRREGADFSLPLSDSRWIQTPICSGNPPSLSPLPLPALSGSGPGLPAAAAQRCRERRGLPAIQGRGE